MRKELCREAAAVPVKGRRAKWKKTAGVLACAVALGTVYALTLPAAALEGEPLCGKTEHTHSIHCCTQVTGRELICTPERLGIHRHTESCYDGDENLTCGQADFVVHEHGDGCFDAGGVLVCPLDEIEAHTHGEGCYALPEHAHTEACHTRERGELICGLVEGKAAHAHSAEAGCYTDARQLTCGLEESQGHEHTEDCYAADGILTCDLPEVEGHAHTDECYTVTPELTCEISTEPHSHTDACYVWNDALTCGLEEGPIEGAEPELVCGKEEIELHEHTEDCYETGEDGNTYLICDKIVVLEHEHTAECFTAQAVPVDATEKTCGQEEREGHAHSSCCYDEDGNLICGRDEAPGHRHTPLCYGQWNLTCGTEEHTHTEACTVPPLTQEEQAQAEEVTARIAELPTREQVEQTLAGLESDEAGYNAYLKALGIQVAAAYDSYDALSESARAQVANLERLTALDWLRSATLEEPPSPGGNLPTVTVGETAAAVEAWAPPEGSTAAAQLKTALLGVEPGYAIQTIKYYKITGLNGGPASVTGWTPEAGDVQNPAIFVYDLGADGTAVQSCAVTAAAPGENGTYSFTFTPVPSEEPRICAFISAKPATLADMGIYLGEKQADGYWTAMDGPDEGSATVKVEIRLAENFTALPNHFPFISKVNPWEQFYPEEDAVRRAVGDVNDVQCYKIHWVEKKSDGTYNFNTPMEAGNGKNATITLTYLKSDARLQGPAGGRKLRVFSSQAEDGRKLIEISNSVQNVRLAGDSYEGFSFQVTEKCPYVFVSERVEKGYVEGLAIASIVDGSAPFDSSDIPGNDSGDSNKIVRSYDTIQYNLGATFRAREEGITQKTVNMYFELTLKKSATAARFDTSKMLWVGQNYGVEYLDEKGDVIMILAHDGKYYAPKVDESGNVLRDLHGFAQADTAKPVSMNAQVAGSTEGENSYKVASGGVAEQRLVGWTTLTAKDGKNILAGTQTFPMAIEVRNADHGEVFAPKFKMWLEGNEENYGPETEENGVMLPAQPLDGNVLDIGQREQYQVTVSAGTNFNVQLKKNTDMSYKNWFDFSTGQAVAGEDRAELERLAALEENRGKSNPAEFTENDQPLDAGTKAKYSSYRYGRLTCYGITLQLYNDTEEESNRASKGFRGLSLPVGPITFDLNFASEAHSKAAGEEVEPDEYTAILWDYNENIPANTRYTASYVDPDRGDKILSDGTGLGNGGRNLYWDGEIRSAYAKGGGPSNYQVYHDGCYYGGDWTLVGENGSTVNLSDVANPTMVTGTGQDTTYHFSVSDYDFDFDTQHFPLRDAGNSNTVAGYNTYARCFSAGCVQVLSVFPRVQKVSEAEIFLNTTVSNLKLTTRAGQPLQAKDDDATRIAHEVNTADNMKKDQIVLYAPGNLTKGSSFNGKDEKNREPNSTAMGFLGTEYWTTSYDCSTFAGDDIWIVSYGMISSGSDYRMKSMNLLQLFDSRALCVRGDPDVCQSWDPAYDEKGTAAFLYAADPDYPDGYDTNKDGVLAYMNTVREEDLVYYTSLEELKRSGYTCIGVLMELRGCNLLGGKYQYMRIPVKVNADDEALVSKTVATVNTFRVWSYDLNGVSWANGQWDEETGKNTLEGFPKPANTIDSNGNYSGELANRETGSPPYYTKTEYRDGLQVNGTHSGGTLSGNSLLILGYKAGINITVDKGSPSTGVVTYNLGDGETVVDYRLTNIRTDVSDFTSQPDSPTTHLTVKAVLDEGHTGEQRISASGGSFRITGYAVENGQAALEETSIPISSDSHNPTVLEYAGSDGKRHRIQVYAQPGAGNQSVTFEILDAPVGIHLPDITFQANFAAVTALRDNDTIKTSAYISGTSDNRAYDQTKGNTDNITVGVVLRSGTNLTKAVNTRYIELDGTIQYDVTYTNSGTDVIQKIYFYDLLPHESDIRGSDFTGKVILREMDVTSSGEGGAAPASATVYYSTTDYSELYDRVSVFGGSVDDNGQTSGMNADAVEEMLERGENNAGGTLFHLLGTVTNGKFEYDSTLKSMTGTEKTALMSTVTGLYAKVEKLQKGQTVTMTITVQTEGNEADDWYKNIANSWIANSATLPLTSNKVETQTVSRSISGLVWHDLNLDGVRDPGEPLLQGVTATLFRLGLDGRYEVCGENVRKNPIQPIETGADGAYCFNDLAKGDYIVAFSGEGLKKYTGATSYQKNGQNDSATSDGKAVQTGSPVDPQTYAYYIQFSEKSAPMSLHSIQQMQTVVLNNGVEAYTNQDLGLIIATYALPDTGGSGSGLYILGGLALMAASAMLLWNPGKKRGKGDFASS